MINGVLFDLDGTLVDSAPDLVGALNHVREVEGLEALDPLQYRQYASTGAIGLIRAGMPPSRQSEAGWKARFLDYYANNSLQKTRLFPGTVRLLDGLASRGLPWGVVTNKAEALTLPIMDALGLLSRAACVICGDTLAQSKPHPAPVTLACELLGLDPVRVLMVGDDLRDIQSGQMAGTLTAFAAYGYVTCDPRDANEASGWVIDRPQALLAIIDGLRSHSGSNHVDFA